MRQSSHRTYKMYPSLSEGTEGPHVPTGLKNVNFLSVIVFLFLTRQILMSPFGFSAAILTRLTEIVGFLQHYLIIWVSPSWWHLEKSSNPATFFPLRCCGLKVHFSPISPNVWEWPHFGPVCWRKAFPSLTRKRGCADVWKYSCFHKSV